MCTFSEFITNINIVLFIQTVFRFACPLTDVLIPSQFYFVKPGITTEAEAEVTLQLTVSQSVLVSSTLVGLATRY
jgi:hypothetical protein